MLCFILFLRWGVLWVWVQFLSHWNRNEAEEIRERILSVRLTVHTEDTLVKAEEARLFQFCNSPLIIAHYGGKKGNRHTENRQESKSDVYDQKEYSEDPTPRTRDSKLPDVRGKHLTFHPRSSASPYNQWEAVWHAFQPLIEPRRQRHMRGIIVRCQDA